MSRTLDTLLTALLAAECRPIRCPVARLQHATSRVETLLRDEFGMTETAKELAALREAIEPAPLIHPGMPAGEDVLTGRKIKRKPAAAEAT